MDQIGDAKNRPRNVKLDELALAGLRKMPVDIFDNVYVGEIQEAALVLCLDVRNFSDFLCCNDEDDVFRLITTFTSNLLSCVNQFGYGCSYYKLMGDGALIIWDKISPAKVQEATTIFNTYTEFLDEDLFKPYPTLGLAGALVQEKVYKYEISAETSQLKYRDYVGYGINLACRIQAIAKKDELMVNANLANSGHLSCESSEDPVLLAELGGLKGLKSEDRERVYRYVRGT